MKNFNVLLTVKRLLVLAFVFLFTTNIFAALETTSEMPSSNITRSSEKLPYKLGVKYFNTTDSNSSEAQKSEGFKFQRNVSTYGLFFGYSFTPNDTLTASPKFVSTLDRKKSESGRIVSDNIELKYKKKNFISSDITYLNMIIELRQEIYSSNEKRLKEQASGESKFYLTGIKDVNSKFNLFAEYRLGVRERTSSAKNTQRHEQKMIFTPSYRFNEKLKAGPGVYYQYTDMIQDHVHSLNFRPQIMYNTAGLEIILDAKFSKIVTDRAGKPIEYNSRAFKTPSIELEITWDFI